MARPKAFEPDEVLDRVVEVFRDLGYAATSLSDLTGRVGVGRQSLYDTFGSKDRLWALALARYRQRQGEAMLAALEDDDVVDGLRRVLDWLATDTCDDPRGCLVVAAAGERVPSDPESTRQVTEQFAAIVDAFSLAIRRGQAAGQVATDLDADVQAELLLVVAQGLRVVGKVRADRQRMQAAIDATLAPLHA